MRFIVFFVIAFLMSMGVTLWTADKVENVMTSLAD